MDTNSRSNKAVQNQVQILRRQFPLRAASAKTIHHCQGDTLNAVVVDFPCSAQEHMHYVGLSRVQNSSSLHLLSLNEHKIRVNEKVVNEMNRLIKVPSNSYNFSDTQNSK